MRLHGLIERQPHSNRYVVTSDGKRIALFFVRTEARFLRVLLSLGPPLASDSAPKDLVDASLVVLAEHLGHGCIVSTDRRDFHTYRWKNRHPFTNLLEPLP